MSIAAPPRPKTGVIYDTLLATADRLAVHLRATAAGRERAHATPRPEIELLRESDLLQVQEPIAYGGSDLDYAEAVQLVRRIARGDTAIAHLLGHHYAQTREDERAAAAVAVSEAEVVATRTALEATARLHCTPAFSHPR
jgi:Acyl-CoA dehydrogenase, N-terminal domain